MFWPFVVRSRMPLARNVQASNMARWASCCGTIFRWCEKKRLGMEFRGDLLAKRLSDGVDEFIKALFSASLISAKNAKGKICDLCGWWLWSAQTGSLFRYRFIDFA